MAALATELDRLLQGWLPAQRWFPAKGRSFRLGDVGMVELPSPGPGLAGPGVSLQHRLIAVSVEGGTQIVQVPLVLSPHGTADDPGYVGTIDGRLVFDGPRHPAYVAALLELIGQGRQLAGSMTVSGHATGRAEHDPPAPARVLSGEQSNTSIIVSAEYPLMVKLFRVVSDGPNPDVEVTAALSQAGTDAVAHVAGWVSGGWTAPDGQPASGHLAVSAEFVDDGRDAWREATEAAAAGVDFTTSATGLGRVTAQVHAALLTGLGGHPATDENVAELVTGLQARVAWAMREVPELSGHAEALTAHSDSLAGMGPDDVGQLQRVHGDYHLGQVLHSPRRGWILLDFEGEPLRPLAERVRPDVSVRDVVGMIRSFDYAAGFVAVAHPDRAVAAREWAAAAQAGFLAGYQEVSGDERARPGGRLFDALLVDKALYEVVYEARNRPDWIGIPLAAIEGVVAGRHGNTGE